MSTQTANRPLSVRDVLKIANFRRLWFSQIVSEFGDNLTNLSLLILINRLTGSTAALAGMTIVLLVPQVTFGMLAGVYVDRLNRKQIMIISDLLRGLLVLGFVFVNSPNQIWILYVLGFLQATVGTFFMPAQNAMMPAIVPAEGLMAANSLRETSRVICLTVGSGTAGVISGVFGVVWPSFLLDSLTFFIAIALVFAIRLPAFVPKTQRKATPGVIYSQLIEGLKIVVQTRALLGTMVAAGVALLGLGAANVLFVPLITREMHAPESWLGVVQIGATAGMILSGSLVAILAARVKPTALVSYGIIGLGLTVSILGLTNSPWQMVVVQIFAGCTVPAINASIVTINQRAVNDEIRGRVGAARMTIGSVCSLLSMAFAGIFGDLIGVRNVFLLAGCFVIAAGFISGWIFRGDTARTEVARV